MFGRVREEEKEYCLSLLDLVVTELAGGELPHVRGFFVYSVSSWPAVVLSVLGYASMDGKKRKRPPIVAYYAHEGNFGQLLDGMLGSTTAGVRVHPDILQRNPWMR